MENKRFLTAQDVMEMLGVSLSYSYTDKKDSGTKKSYMGIVRKEKIGYSKNSYQI